MYIRLRCGRVCVDLRRRHVWKPSNICRIGTVSLHLCLSLHSGYVFLLCDSAGVSCKYRKCSVNAYGLSSPVHAHSLQIILGFIFLLADVTCEILLVGVNQLMLNQIEFSFEDFCTNFAGVLVICTCVDVLIIFVHFIGHIHSTVVSWPITIERMCRIRPKIDLKCHFPTWPDIFSL